jgi:hypothetical protein
LMPAQLKTPSRRLLWLSRAAATVSATDVLDETSHACRECLSTEGKDRARVVSAAWLMSHRAREAPRAASLRAVARLFCWKA